MKKTIEFIEGDPDFEKLKTHLCKMGIYLYSSGGTWTAEVDNDRLYKEKTRLAGRKLKPMKQNGFIVDITLSEVEQRMAKESAEEIAASLGVSRSTLFRRMKFAREFGIEEL